MRRIALVVFGAVLVSCCTAFAATRGGRGAGFRLPDASAACRLERGTLVCRSLGVREGLALPARGTPRAIGARVWWDASTPVLHRWTRDGVVCRTSGGAILCTNATGATIRVGSRRIAVAL